MDTFADIFCWVLFAFGVGLFSYGTYGYIKERI